MMHLSTVLAIVMGAILSIPTTYWALDRDGPYKRLFGIIEAEQPSECGLDANTPFGILPLSCVTVEWSLTDYYKANSCYPVSSNHVSRTITDANGYHELAKTERVFGPGKKPFASKIRRPFILPAFSVPGPASYYSEACFICNPLQWALNWPVCVNTPTVYYEVEKSK